jgi:hypothetical protein
VCLPLDLRVSVSVSVSVDSVDAEDGNLRRLREPNIVVELYVVRVLSKVATGMNERRAENNRTRTLTIYISNPNYLRRALSKPVQ